MRGLLEKWHRWLLLAVFLLVSAALWMPSIPRPGESFQYVFVVDITRSMNVEDYKIEQRAISRLEFSKQALIRAIGALPCGSRVGLGVFTERQSTLLFAPIEICEGYHEIAEAIDHLHWGMAWAADSRIAKGFQSALQLFRDLDAKLVFVTDGHESPPLNPRYTTSFDEFKGKVQGLIVGVGGLTPAPIPKFDAHGKRMGYYRAEDVPHRSTFGLSHLDPSEIEGYNARNAPFGNQAVIGSEHLSALRENYLKKLSTQSGFAYHRLTTFEQFSEALRSPALAETRPVPVDFAWLPASVALGILVLLYLGGAYFDR